MEKSDWAGVCVFSERHDVALELLAAGARLAEQLGGPLASIEIGPAAPSRAAEDVACGAERVLVVGHPALGSIRADLYAAALRQAVERLRPAVILVGATRTGTEIAARVAQAMGVGCAAECTRLDPAERGGLLVEKRYYGGKFVARRVIEAVPAMVTVQPRKFDPPPRQAGRQGRIEETAVEPGAPESRVLAVEPRKRSGVEIAKAEVVVSVGRGVKRPEDLAIIRDLAESLGGVIGASRPITQELQWLPVDVQVGLSGTTVKPKLYIACGISGQVEHVVGMRGSGVVVAINTDPNAPIMHEADYRIVGDLYEVVPALTRALRSAAESVPPGPMSGAA